MTTVKEFKDLGVEFVTDDKVQWRHGNMAGVISFAWRPLSTLPDDAKFKYDINYGDHSWRPSLDQSVDIYSCDDNDDGEVTVKYVDGSEKHINTLGYCANKTIIPDMTLKPVFTQVMADAGELPPIGSRILIRHICWNPNKPCDEVTVKAISDEYIIVSTGSKTIGYSEQHYKIASMRFKPVDTRTPKQKAVDDALELIGYTNDGEVAIHLGQVYDLWNKQC